MQLDQRDIQAKDIAIAAPSPEHIVARIEAPNTRLLLTVADQQMLLRRAYPGLEVKRRHAADILFMTHQRHIEAAARGICYRLRHNVAEGDYVARDDFAPTACDAAATPVKLAYDKAARALFSRSDLPAFSYAGAITLRSSDPVRAGTAMTLRTISGPVTIDRNVVTLQASRAGQHIFVRTKDGTVLAHPLADTLNERPAE